VKASSACSELQGTHWRAAAWDFQDRQIVNERKKPFQRLLAKQTGLLHTS
jgi:hypothetical protein